MKLKNSIFVSGFIPALRNLLAEKVTASQAFALRKLAKEVDAKFLVYEEARKDLIKQYAELDDSGEIAVNDKGEAKIIDAEGFNKVFAELLAIEEEYDAEKTSLSDDIKLSTNDLILLEDIINV